MHNIYSIKKEVNAFKCLKCHHEWIPRVPMVELETTINPENIPVICPKCKSAYWNKQRKKAKKGAI